MHPAPRHCSSLAYGIGARPSRCGRLPALGVKPACDTGHSRIRRHVAFVVLLALAPALLHADYKESYKKGLSAVESKKWAEAARLMQEAIAEKPKEGESIRLYGQRFETYLPHYYLGLSLYGAGNCEAAVKAFLESESQGAIKKSGEYKTLTKNVGACQAQLAQAGPKPPATTPTSPTAAKPAGPDPAAVAQATQAAAAEIERAEKALRGLTPMQSDPLLANVWPQDPALGPAQQRSRDTLAQASARLGEGRAKSDLAALQQARDLGKQAADQAEAVTSAASRKRSDAKSAQLRAEEEARHKAAAATRPTTPPATATSAEKPPSPAMTPPPTPLASAGPPQALVTAAQAFFAGQYQRTAELLPQPESLGGKAAVQGLALRAAARYAAYLATGEKDTALLEQARSDVRSVRNLDRGFSLDRQSFSPRVVEFFQTTR